MSVARGIGRWLVAGVVALSLASGAAAQPAAQRRAALEQRFRERVGQLVQRRLQLTNDQAAKLRASNQRFEPRRRELLREEREVRQALRRELAGGGASANQGEVSRLLDQMLSIHRRRLGIAEEEQRDLAAFLTPVQRAKYFALQDEVRRRMEELRRRRAGDATAPAERRRRALAPR